MKETEINEKDVLKGLTEKGDVIGEFVMSKRVPTIYKKIKERGINTLEDIYG